MTPARDRSLRRAGAFDASLLAALHQECHAMAADLPAWNAEAMAGLLAAPGHLALVAEEADQPAGFILARFSAGEMEILSLGVRARCRRRGVARELLHAALCQLADRGARSAFLEVAADNVAARALYRSLGFSPVGRRTAYYGRADDRVDAVIYRRELGQQVDAIPR